MNRAPTFYETLGLESNAAVSEIRLAHRRLVQQSHPDKVHHLLIEFPWVEKEAALRYERISEAFNILSDDAARSRYDSELNKQWPNFVSRYAPPICDPVRHSQPIQEPRTSYSRIHTRAPEAVAAEPTHPQHLPFHRHSIPKQSPSRQLDPRAPKRRTNVFVGALALVAALAVIYGTSHYQQLDQKTSDWLMQQEHSPNTVIYPTPTPAPSSPSKLEKK